MITFNPSRILYGPDFEKLLAEAATRVRLGRHALIVTSEELTRDGTTAMLQAGLEAEGVDSILFDGVGDDSGSEAIEEVSSLASNGRADYIIGAGPPVLLDIAKIACLAAGASLPFLAVPTRCWNPLLFSPLAAIKDAREGSVKLVRDAPYPDGVYYLSGILEHLTGKQAVYDLLCIIADCIEAIDKNGESIGYPLVSHAIEQALSILRAIPVTDRPLERDKIQVAGIHAAWFFPSPGAGFALGRSAHSRTGVSPEWVTAALLPVVGGYRSRLHPELCERLRRILGLEPADGRIDDSGEIEMEIRSLTALADVPLRLRDLGLESYGLAGIAGPAAAICDIGEDALLGLLNTAL